MSTSLWPKTRSLMGHTRIATQGSARRNHNNSPFPGWWFCGRRRYECLGGHDLRLDAYVCREAAMLRFIFRRGSLLGIRLMAEDTP